MSFVDQNWRIFVAIPASATRRAVRVRPPAWLGADGAGDTVGVDHEARRAVDVNETRKYGLMSGLWLQEKQFHGNNTYHVHASTVAR